MPSVREASERIEVLLDELARRDPDVLHRVEELVQHVMSLYGAGLERVLEIGGPELARALADDDLVGNLLVLHDLSPDDPETRVQRALDRVRPYLGSHAGGVTLAGVDAEGVVHLRLEGSCDGCPSSALTVRSALEDAVLAACPDVVAVEAEGMVDPGPALLQIEPYRPRESTGAGGWSRLDLDVPPRTVQGLEVAGVRLAVANLDGTLVAYLDRCPGCLGPLSTGALTADRLTCAGCGREYDARRAGRATGADGPALVPLPLLPDQGAWKVALPEVARP